ncbi:MAG: class I mannose-6-phosphate isomerase [Firmicutes bacterium]|nr:class I mannose-6-phosphate isomerase [Bacillota bacterium]
MKITPALKSYIWGGTKLKSKFGKVSDEKTIAESWEFSVHPDGMSLTEEGKPLADVLTSENLGENSKDGLEFLIKLIDAEDNLSVQVHPNDEYAKKVNSFGKREMWYIIDAEKNAGIYCGFKHDMTRDDLENDLKNGTILEKLNFFPVKQGDCFFIEAGTIHAIGKGVTLYEVQQSSNLTYRLYDFKRVGTDGQPRELHIEDALNVSTYSKYEKLDKKIKTNDGLTRLGGCKSFTAYELEIDGEQFLKGSEKTFAVLTLIEGSATIELKNKKTSLILGGTFFVPANQDIFITGKCKIIISKSVKYYIKQTQKDNCIIDDNNLIIARSTNLENEQQLLKNSNLKKEDITSVFNILDGEC